MNLNIASWWRAAKLTAKFTIRFLGFMLLLGAVVWIWASSFRLIALACRTPLPAKLAQNSENLFTLLFGASSIALFIFSFLVSAAGVIGWRSFKEFQEKVTADVGAIRNELKGRVATNLGYVIGEMSLKPGSFDMEDKDRLEQAVGQCREGHRYLNMLGAGTPAEALALNNLLFYACILHEPDVHRKDEDFMLREARRLKDLGEQHNSTMLKLTAYRVLLAYPSKPEEKAKAINGLRSLLANSSKISERERKEAESYLKKYATPTSGPSPSKGQKPKGQNP